MGGSPCQSLSIVQSQFRQHLFGKSKLFFEFVRALEELSPKYFLFENVASMTEESKQIISELLKCEPILINSNCFSAQDRPRLYWTNIPNVKAELKPSETMLKDIMEGYVSEKYFYNYPLENIDMSKQVCAMMVYNNHDMHKRIFNPSFKCHTLTTCGGGNTQKKVLDGNRARKLTPLEYERLQTLPDNYTVGIAETHRYTAIGNGWTADVIAHILSNIPENYLQVTVSLFDGISCGQVALGKAGKQYNQYYASEIDPYAIQVTQTNHPHTMQLGDITKIDWETFKDRVNIIQKVS